MTAHRISRAEKSLTRAENGSGCRIFSAFRSPAFGTSWSADMSLREFANRGCKIDATGSQESGYRLAEGGLNHGIGKPLEINVLGYKIAEGRWSKI